MVFHGSDDKKNRKAGLTGDLAPAIPGIHPHLYQSPAMRQSILASEGRENAKSTTHEWYLEGFAGSAPLVNAAEDGTFIQRKHIGRLLYV
uniref:Uncharacterized protein n=1 Tax=Solanum lycopersicum TaxID=4081 RepID=A0A3Q7G5A1_SOLLC